jgi:hypothetical protein
MEIIMPKQNTKTWLILVHQIPPKPNALRVKIWRRLQQVGAVAVKQSVYVMPLSDQSREDLSWILKEIVAGGGDGSISEAHFVEGITDAQIIALFHQARRADYEKLIQDANALLAEWTINEIDSRHPAAKSTAQLARLQRRLSAISAIDFFNIPERNTAELLIKELINHISRPSAVENTTVTGMGNLTGKTWVTRSNLFVDRIACGWLIRRFIDKTAVFKFVSGSRYDPVPDEIRFDMFDGEYTHEGDLCSFEVMIQRIQLQDHALCPLAEIVHDIDLKDEKYGRSETAGFNALLTGLVAAEPDDDRRMTQGSRLFDNLYAYYQRQKRE